MWLAAARDLATARVVPPALGLRWVIVHLHVPRCWADELAPPQPCLVGVVLSHFFAVYEHVAHLVEVAIDVWGLLGDSWPRFASLRVKS